VREHRLDTPAKRVVALARSDQKRGAILSAARERFAKDLRRR
jgi:hypothetical protein